MALALALMAPGSGAAEAQSAGPGSAPGPAPEALFVSGIRHAEGRSMKEGLRELERAVAARPSWQPARNALAAALLRGGEFERAGEEYARIMGRELAHDLSLGKLKASGVRGVVDPELVFGLAVSRQFAGRAREADRLYVAFADLVGESSPDAARAYLRLAEMFSDRGIPWGDAEALRAKALAVDPDAESRSLLPAIPDPSLVPEAEPYARAIELDPEAPAMAEGYESLPVLENWVNPCMPGQEEEKAAAKEPAGNTAVVRILIDAEGRPSDVGLPTDAPTKELPAGVRDAVMAWRFEPARANGDPVSAWILFEVPVSCEKQGAAADSTAAPADSLGGGEGDR